MYNKILKCLFLFSYPMIELYTITTCSNYLNILEYLHLQIFFVIRTSRKRKCSILCKLFHDVTMVIAHALTILAAC